MSALCWRCAEDEYLKRIIQEQGDPQECSVCGGSEEKAFSVSDLAQLIDPIIREHFSLGPEVKQFGADDDEWYEQEGESLSDHLQEVIGQFLGFEDEIVEELEDTEDVRPQDGEDPFYDTSQNYVETPIRPYNLRFDWTSTLEDLKHRNRFFSSAASQLFKTLFDDVEQHKWWNIETRADESVIRELPVGSTIYRARICDSTDLLKDAYKDPCKHIGPPPPAKARAGRMNSEGVAVFYGALEDDTCLAETRPAMGNDVVVIKLLTTKSLRLLDFTRLEESYKGLSYFQTDFKEQAEKGAFLRSLQSLISQPIVPGREMDYLITQTMAEYLAHIHPVRFDGILFKSVQRSGGINIVIFPDGPDKFPLEYVPDSFKLYRTDSVEYEHHTRHMGLIEGELWFDDDYDQDW